REHKRTRTKLHLLNRLAKIVMGRWSLLSARTSMRSPENESPDDPLRAHGITIRDSAEPVSPDQLDRIERSLKGRLPAEYRSFLLRANGGVPAPGLFHYIAIDED